MPFCEAEAANASLHRHLLSSGGCAAPYAQQLLPSHHLPPQHTSEPCLLAKEPQTAQKMMPEPCRHVGMPAWLLILMWNLGVRHQVICFSHQAPLHPSPYPERCFDSGLSSVPALSSVTVTDFLTTQITHILQMSSNPWPSPHT